MIKIIIQRVKILDQFLQLGKESKMMRMKIIVALQNLIKINQNVNIVDINLSINRVGDRKKKFAINCIKQIK